MNFDLPLNRKEKHWSACCLPHIICGDNMEHLSSFLELVGVPEKFLKKSYGIGELDFYAEYSLKDSCRDWDLKVSGMIPDIIILIKNGSDTFLIVLECKFFGRESAKRIRKQLDAQKAIARGIMEKLGIDENNFIHTLIALELPDGFTQGEKEVILRWEDILKKYKCKEKTYFYEQLKIASSRTELISREVDSFCPYATGKWTWKKIVAYYKSVGNFFVGRKGGINQLEADCSDEKVKSHPYQVNISLVPGKNKAPGNTGTNWFPASEFIKKLSEYGYPLN